ncbi:hypothetical protein SCAR479_06099 [Seiridium cardinale]|uniref:Uncharacterized protein n=1 Tax=Seiridium cardinale TaxID=138064 RepID=A0ABR2XUY9_9PEZI
MDESRQTRTDVTRGQMDGSRTQLDRPVSRIQLGKNFSYPRPDGHPIRHESADSRSSVNSNGSLPGMTDSSDSEASADDDYHYNSSASELWDSFWPNGAERTHRTQKSQSSVVSQSQSQDHFSLDYYTTTRFEETEDDAVTITQAGQDATGAKSSQWPLSRPPSTQQDSKSAPGTISYSVYPKPTPLPTRITQLPPRSSSLTLEPSVPPLKTSKSFGHLRARLASPPTLQLTPPSAPSDTTTAQTSAIPVPAPLLCPPQRLRPSTSACNIREKSHHNAAAPLCPVPVPPIPDQLRSAPPQIEHFVSVFDFDSDSEPAIENDTFAKRIARGLQHKKSLKEMGSKKTEGHLKGHKKSASEKSTLSPHKKSSTANDESGGSLGRKRGGSLGRMLGFKNSK